MKIILHFWIRFHSFAALQGLVVRFALFQKGLSSSHAVVGEQLSKICLLFDPSYRTAMQQNAIWAILCS